jgi:hypothetical protein
VRGHHGMLKAALPGVWRIAADSLTREKWAAGMTAARSTEYKLSRFPAYLTD